MESESLSDKIFFNNAYKCDCKNTTEHNYDACIRPENAIEKHYLKLEDVREAVKKLKEEMDKWIINEIELDIAYKIIDKIFGEKLC